MFLLLLGAVCVVLLTAMIACYAIGHSVGHVRGFKEGRRFR